MSYLHTQRRKLIRRLKLKWGDKWYPHFEEHIQKVKKELQGDLIGTLQDIFDLRRKQQFGPEVPQNPPLSEPR
jgi:hypothetical protein